MTKERKKPKKPFSANAKTLEQCRKLGWHAQTVEQTVPKTFIKRDLFGVIDIIAVTNGEPAHPARILGIQATSGRHHSARVAKIIAEPRARAWVDAGGLLEVWTWEKQGARGKRKLWTLRRERIEPARFASP
jgi:hypothetical protein